MFKIPKREYTAEFKELAVKRVTDGQAIGPVALYASVGPELTHYDVDAEGAALIKRGSVMLPANVQEAWQHASKRFLYVISSNRVHRGNRTLGDTHHLAAFRIEPATGALQAHGTPMALRHRPIHMTTDLPSENVLIAYSNPSGVSVHRINRDGTVGEEVVQPGSLDTGIYPHQIRVAPSNRLVILVTRGHDTDGAKAEEPGALKVFDYKDGLLTNKVSIAPGGGYGFRSRHLDFHPSQPWAYVSLESQNRLDVFKLDGDTLSPAALFSKDMLIDPGNVRGRQHAGTVHVHPNGRLVYAANRADTTVEFEGKQVFIGGENNIPVYAINQSTGEPTLIQHEDTRGSYPRTFCIDPSGRILVAANQAPLLVRDGNSIRILPASLAVFRIGGDGKLEYVRKYDVEVRGQDMFWMGIVAL
ncbi:MAG: beta-propeller fold lactonase family protein [Betaproteobacteria bacterium]|nr:beta-propeller fold lactonase family protein [Betaproteobacteria bacterium]